jgi:hypothetical protein
MRAVGFVFFEILGPKNATLISCPTSREASAHEPASEKLQGTGFALVRDQACKPTAYDGQQGERYPLMVRNPLGSLF